MQDTTDKPKHMRTAVIAGVGLLIAIPLIWHGCGEGFDDFEDPDDIAEGGDENEDDGAAEAGGADHGSNPGEGDDEGPGEGDDEGPGEGDDEGPGDEGGDDEGGDDEGGEPSQNNQEATCVPLVAGQHSRAGSVCVSVNYDIDTSTHCDANGSRGVINAVYTTVDGWLLDELHFVAGDEFADIPLNAGGNPKVGHFDHKAEGLSSTTTSHTFQIPLCKLDMDGAADKCQATNAFFAAHAAVHKGDQSETAWGDGERINEKGSWAMYFNVLLHCGAGQPPIEQCESAFAQAPTNVCFIGADFDADGVDDGIDRWGWTNGPVSPGTKEIWPVYAAAGNCEAAMATHVGNLHVNYGTDQSMNLSFARIGDFHLQEEHIHVGSAPVITNAVGELSVDPSDYGNVYVDLPNVTTTDHQITGLDGDVYVVYHAVSCGTFWDE